MKRKKPKPIYKMDRLMRVGGYPTTKLHAEVMSYTVGTRWGKGVKKQVAGKRLIDFANLPKSAEDIYVRFGKYGKKGWVQSKRKWTRKQVITYFEPF